MKFYRSMHGVPCAVFFALACQPGDGHDALRSERGDQVAEDAVNTIRLYTVRAEVVALPSPREPRSLKLRHEAIERFQDIHGEEVGMAAMTMPFLISESLALDGIAVGDKVEATVMINWLADVPQQVTSVRELPPDTELELGQ